MTVDEAARRLRDLYDAGTAHRKQAAAVHLFAIRYADDLTRLPIPLVLHRAGLPASYRTEIAKGINLAEYVQVVRDFP